MKIKLLFTMFLISLGTIISQTATKPYQFIAKMYTEALGRIPDQTAWNTNENDMQNRSSITVSYLQQKIRDFYLGSEFLLDYPTSNSYGHQARLLALFRGVLNREPITSTFSSYHARLDAGQSWDIIVEDLLSSSECTTALNNIINAASNGKPYYGWTNEAPITINTNYDHTTSSSFNGTQTELQNLLNNLGSLGGSQTLTLAPMALITLTSTLIIPGNVTLTTAHHIVMH